MIRLVLVQTMRISFFIFSNTEKRHKNWRVAGITKTLSPQCKNRLIHFSAKSILWKIYVYSKNFKMRKSGYNQFLHGSDYACQDVSKELVLIQVYSEKSTGCEPNIDTALIWNCGRYRQSGTKQIVARESRESGQLIDGNFPAKYLIFIPIKGRQK